MLEACNHEEVWNWGKLSSLPLEWEKIFLTCTNQEGFPSISDLVGILETGTDCIYWSLFQEKTNTAKHIPVELLKSNKRKLPEICKSHTTSSPHPANYTRRFHEI